MNKNNKIDYAFFDLDGTLITKDSYLPFLFGWLGRHPKKIFQVLALPFYVLNYFIGKKDRIYIKQAFLRAFMQGASFEEVNSYVNTFWENFFPKYQNPKVIDRLNMHRNEGKYTYIVSASFDFYVQYLKNLLPVDGIIATKAEWKDGKLTGRVVGENCLGINKVHRIEEELGFKIRRKHFYAYSDSDVDAPLLNAAEMAVKVTGKKLEKWKS